MKKSKTKHNKYLSCKVIIQTDYMDEPMVGYIKRIRLEVEMEDGKQTLVSTSKIKYIEEVK